jgi:hypothetical protein
LYIVKEYRLEKKNIEQQTLYITKDADIVGFRDAGTYIALIAVTDFAETHTSLRTFKIYSADSPIYHEGRLKYIGCFTGSVGVQYIFEHIYG